MKTKGALIALVGLATVPVLLIGPGLRGTPLFILSSAEACGVKTAQTPAPSPAKARFLAFVEAKRNHAEGVKGLGRAWAVTVSPDGKHIYAAGFKDSAVAVFSRDETMGRLSFVEAQKDEVGGVDGIAGACFTAISPDGRHLYVAGHWDHAIAVFDRDKATGRLTFVEVQIEGIGGVNGLNVVQGVAVSPDGKHVYTAAYRSYGVAVFNRDEATGKLTFVEIHKDGVAGVKGLKGASSVTVSPDGEYVYATGYFDSAVAVFRRDRITGKLTFAEVMREGEGGANGLQGPCAVTVAPDGKHIYVASTGDSAVAVFLRDPIRGKLTFVEAQQDGVGGVDGLSATQGVAVAPDGKRVYATSWGKNALMVFSRDTITGKLSPVEVKRDGIDGVDGLQGASSVTVSPDGKHIYVAGSGAQAVTVFRALDP